VDFVHIDTALLTRLYALIAVEHRSRRAHLVGVSTYLHVQVPFGTRRVLVGGSTSTGVRVLEVFGVELVIGAVFCDVEQRLVDLLAQWRTGR
jgi:hypothetical protein